MSDDRCPACEAPAVGGRSGCQALFDEINAQAFADLRLASVRDLALDAYCMQHVETYCRSAKSYAAHLTRLCCGLEYNASPAVYAAIQKWLNGSRRLEKPALLTERGRLTVVDVSQAASPEDYQRRLQAWAADVWQAYAGQHELARRWLHEALGE
ncbi:MAG TPA: DUF5946 family protein [Anaerolineales bacterium]